MEADLVTRPGHGWNPARTWIVGASRVLSAQERSCKPLYDCSCRGITRRCELPARSPAGAALAVVVTELLLVARFPDDRLVVFGRVLDLFLCPVDDHTLVLVVDPRDHAGRQHDLVAG